MENLREKLGLEFDVKFGTENKSARKYFFAPGRVNLIGEHIDFNGGLVLPCSIDMGTYAIVEKRDDKKVSMYSMNFENLGVIDFDIDSIKFDKAKDWVNYPMGLFKEFLDKKIELSHGFNILFYGDLPNGAGLSSSASLEVLMGTILNDYFSAGFDGVKIAQMSKHSENTFNGVNCGIMDQFAVANGSKGKAVKLDCNTLKYELVPMEIGNYKIVIINTNKKRGLVDSEYNLRRSEGDKALEYLQKENDIEYLCDLDRNEFLKQEHLIEEFNCYKRARHAVTENDRTIMAADYLKNGDLVMFGQMMNLSHISLKEDYQVSCKELDTVVELGRPLRGVLGIRMTGAGFGGCCVAIVNGDDVTEFIDYIKPRYKEITSIDADFYVAEIGNGAGEWCE